MRERITAFEEAAGYRFRDGSLLERALTHSSYANEHKSADDNERLEFLGDAVLELTVSEHIYNVFPNLSEGEMTRLRASVVCESTLARKAARLGLGDMLKIGRGEDRNGGRSRDSILSDAFEALIAAIYLDGGYAASKDFIVGQLGDETALVSRDFWRNDCKTHLQEQLQKDSKLPIEYNVIEEKGPDHDKIFVVKLSHGGKVLSRGEGRSKKEAEQNAAMYAIENNELY